jgi:hypothetical protein
MSKFCGQCGMALTPGAAFCGSCGASAPQAAPAAVPAQFTPVPPPMMPVAAPQSVAPVVQAQSSSPWLKIVLVTFIIVFVIGAVAIGGLFYIGHKVSQKAHEIIADASQESTESSPVAGRPSAAAASGAAGSPVSGDACRLLSKEDVSRAIGMTVAETQSTDGGCSYLAKGTASDMGAKHAAAMVGAKGADKKSQGMIEQFASAVGNSTPNKDAGDTQSADGNAVVLAFSIDTNNAEEQMRLNQKVLGFGGLGAVDPLTGIGDEAFAKADSMMFVRKGNKLIRIMYMSCPCTTEAIKPLAKRLVSNL